MCTFAPSLIWPGSKTGPVVGAQSRCEIIISLMPAPAPLAHQITVLPAFLSPARSGARWVINVGFYQPEKSWRTAGKSQYFTPSVAVTGRKSKCFIEWVNLNQIQLPIPEACSAEQEEFKTTQLFENWPRFSQVMACWKLLTKYLISHDFKKCSSQNPLYLCQILMDLKK